MKKHLQKFLFNFVLASLLLANLSFAASSQQPARDFSKEDARPSREWVKDAVIYQIFPRQYSSKGDFNSITADLDRLKDLGVTVLWLMPIHPIGKEKAKGTIGSPYAVKDYYAINPDYGTKEDFQCLIAESHKRGLKVIIDIVANHTAWDSVLMKNRSFYTHNEKGEIVPPEADWADVADLNYDNRELRQYMIEMLKMWIRDYDLDGFRCDVAAYIPTDFWDAARAEVDKVKPDTIWLAEAEKPELLVKAFDLDYSWNIHSALTEALQGQKPAANIRRIWEEQKAEFPKNALRMRFSDNHDERRAIARFGERGALAAQALVFTLDGVPMLYNGMENGDTTESGAPALFERMPVFWQIKARRPEFPKFYRSMIELRKNSAALRRGELSWVKNSAEDKVLSFVRKTAGEELLIVINLANSAFQGSVAASGNFADITPNAEKTNASLPAIWLDAYGFRIFRKVK